MAFPHPWLPPFDYKISILGAGGVGKTSLVKTFFGESFNEKHVPTVDDYYIHSVTFGGFHYSTCIVDTAGTYEFPVMRKLAIESCQAFIVVYALNNEASFHHALGIIDEIYSLKVKQGSESKNIILNLVANKLDIDCRERVISASRAHCELRKRYWIVGEYMEISTKLGFRVEHAFHSLIKLIVADCQEKEKKKGRVRLARKKRSLNEKKAERKHLKTKTKKIKKSGECILS